MSDFRDLDQILSFSTKIGSNKRNEQNHKIDETDLRFTKLNASLHLPSQLFGTPEKMMLGVAGQKDLVEGSTVQQLGCDTWQIGDAR